jgi:hypothetical protein
MRAVVVYFDKLLPIGPAGKITNMNHEIIDHYIATYEIHSDDAKKTLRNK